MGESTNPALELTVDEERCHEHLIRRVTATDERIIVEEVVSFVKTHLRLVLVVDHPFDGARHRVDVDHESGRQADRVPLGRKEAEDDFTLLAGGR